MRYYVIFIVMFLCHHEIGLMAQASPCFSNHSFKVSTFQLIQNGPEKYNTVLSTLGIEYLNPCISGIQNSDAGDSLQVTCEFKDKIRTPEVQVLLLKESNRLFNRFQKYKDYTLVASIGKFSTDQVFKFKLPNRSKFVLFFVNLSNIDDTTAVELSKINIKNE
ncbi:MAG: hypothetical protein IPL23_17325 [Saprospiraceae bacterium]|nr:hypothetical protein [Saprospiraceae bacterium]